MKTAENIGVMLRSKNKLSYCKALKESYTMVWKEIIASAYKNRTVKRETDRRGSYIVCKYIRKIKKIEWINEAEPVTV